jgi:hypothetical protein
MIIYHPTYIAVVELIRALNHMILQGGKNFKLLSVNYLELQYTVYGIRQGDADPQHWTRIQIRHFTLTFHRRTNVPHLS